MNGQTLRLHKLILYLFCYFITLVCYGQTAYCPNDPPINTWLADSPYPTFHRNNYAQSSTCITGPVPSDSIIIKSRTNIKGQTSPWTYISDSYPNGERVLVQSNATHFFKFIDTPQGIITIDSIRIDFDAVSSFGFSFIQAKDNKWFVPDPKYAPQNNQYSRIIKIEDTDPTDPYSELVQTGVYNFQGTNVNKVGHLALNYSGQLVFTGKTDDQNNVAHVGILDQNLNMMDIFEYTTYPNEIVSHNSSPVQEDNSWYLATTHRLIRFDWDGTDISIGWEAFYDFVNDGPTGAFAEGSGTTPTFMGYGNVEDKLIVLADGHNQNNLVAFWRELPQNWTGIPGHDIRFADSITIPLAQASNNTFQSIENSPTVHNYSVAIAQFNGFLGYDCINDKGVQKFTWDTGTNKLQLDWTNNQINMNGALTYSEGSNLVYSSGKESDCNYYMYGLNWSTGNMDLRILLGPEGTFLDDPFYDAGNNTILDEEGNIYFAGGASLIKLEKSNLLNVTDNLITEKLLLSPNPASTMLKIESMNGLILEGYKIIDYTGKILKENELSTDQILIDDLSSGIYILQIKSDDQWIIKRFVKI